jgi:hypothetical protein
MKKILSTLFVLNSFLLIAQPCSDLFFSEYIEGTSNNKAIEIYNPTPNAVSLTGYKVMLFTNGGTTANTTFNLSGTIAAGGTYVIAHSSANATILGKADTTSGVCNFNGNDALLFIKATDTLDIIGVIGFDPGATGWAVGNGFSANNTLVRKQNVQEGTSNWSLGATQWDVLIVDDVTDLDAHTMTSCSNPSDTLVVFSPVAFAVNENAGTYNITLNLNQSTSSSHSVDVELKSGDPADIGSYSTQTVTFASGNTSQTVAVTITDDAFAEPAEQFVFRLKNATGGLLIGADSLFTLTINLSDSVVPNPSVPYYPIATIITVDGVGSPDSLNVRCMTSGTVYGINNRATGLQFTINDGSGGITVFSNPKTYGYNVNEGDSIVVIGKVSFFSGSNQITPDPNAATDTIYKVGTVTLASPLVTTVLDESTENVLIRINNVSLTTPSQWNNSNPAGFDVTVSNGSQSFSVRIDEQTDLFNQAAPVGNFDIIGIGRQFDSSSPYDGGYQIAPRYSADIILLSGIAEKNLNRKELNIYPNPNQGNFIVSVDADKNETVRIIITDVTGKTVVEDNSQLIKGNNTINLNRSLSGSGVYFVMVITESFLAQQRLIIH